MTGDYIRLLRPGSWLIVGVHCGVGGMLSASGLFFHDLVWLKLIFAGAIWGVLGNGGTLALNSAFDRDTMDVGYLDNPPAPPAVLAPFAIAWMGMGAVLALLFFNPLFLVLYLVCMIMSWLYSCPPLRLKSVAGGDIFINSIGYGALTIAAGYAALEGTLSTAMIVISCGFAFLFAGFYPLTQIYQYDYDRSRGDRTLTVWLRPRAALRFATIMVCCAFLIFLYGAAQWRLHFWTVFLILFVFALWIYLLYTWRRYFAPFPHKDGMYDALYLWGLVDVSVILIFHGI